MRRLALLAAFLALPALGCAARIGPEGSWLQWDVCGFEGGAYTRLEVLQSAWELGCQSPASEPAPAAPPNPLAGLGDRGEDCE